MKKRVLLSIFITMLLGTKVFAQNFDLKSYSDYSQDFSGAAAAMFLGEMDSELQSEYDSKLDLLSEQLTEVKKLTKNNNWLLKKAMNEWEFQKGEIYLVFLAENRFSDNGIILFVQVDAKDHYIWRGWTISEDDIDSLPELFGEES